MLYAYVCIYIYKAMQESFTKRSESVTRADTEPWNQCLGCRRSSKRICFEFYERTGSYSARHEMVLSLDAAFQTIVELGGHSYAIGIFITRAMIMNPSKSTITRQDRSFLRESSVKGCMLGAM